MLKRSFMLGLALTALTPLAVSAHGPTRQKVTLTTEVAADPAEVWAAFVDDYPIGEAVVADCAGKECGRCGFVAVL